MPSYFYGAFKAAQSNFISIYKRYYKMVLLSMCMIIGNAVSRSNKPFLMEIFFTKFVNKTNFTSKGKSFSSHFIKIQRHKKTDLKKFSNRVWYFHTTHKCINCKEITNFLNKSIQLSYKNVSLFINHEYIHRNI